MNVMGHLSTLEATGLVRLAQVTPDLEYLFRHTLVQDAAYASLLDQDQRRLHQAVGEALETLYADHLNEMAAALAHHFENAGDRQRALHYFKQAAADALHAYANPEAEDLYRRAICIVENPAESAELHAGLGEALYNLSRYEEAAQTWKMGIEQYQVASNLEGMARQPFQIDSNLEGMARLYARSARAIWFAGDPQRGLELCLQGLKAIQAEEVQNAPDSPALALLVHEAARACHFNGQQDRALELCRQALEMAGRLNAVEVQADALCTLGILPKVSAAEALDALHQAITLAEEAGLLAIAARAHLNSGSMIRSLLGDQAAARTHFERSIELSRRRGAVQEEFMAIEGYASISLQLGELDEVERSLKALEKFTRRLPDPAAARIEINMFHAILHSLRGEVELALPSMRQAAEQCRQRGDLQTLANITSSLADILAEPYRQGQIPDASELEAALNETLALAQRGMASQSVTYAQLASLRALQGRFDEARQAILAGRQAQEPRYAHSELLLDAAEVELAALEGRTEAADAGFRALQSRRNQSSLWHWARLDTSWAEMLLRRGEPADLEHAQELLQGAQAAFIKMGARPMIALTQRLLQTSREQTLALAQAQQKVTQELALAGRIQSSFLPIQPPTLPGWDIAVCLRPARATSGDYYDFIELPNGRMGLVIADVADKGIGAALFMTSTRTLLRAYTTDHPTQPDLALKAANQRITADTHGGLFVTLFYAILDPTSGELLYCNAGHNPPLLRRRSGLEQSLTNTGVPLGVFEDAAWGVGRVRLEPGDILSLYTDGITEAQNTQEALFGEARLHQSIQAAAQAAAPSSTHTLQTILADVERFTAGAAQSDDITLLIITRQV